MAMARDSVGVAARSTVPAEAKLALLEDLQRCTDPAAAAQSAAEWLVAHSGAERTIFAAPDHVRGMLAGIAGAGVPSRQLKKLALPLDDSDHPLISALTNGSAISFHNPRDARLTVFGDTPFTCVKVGGTDDAPALGLMLISPATDMPTVAVKMGRRRARPMPRTRRRLRSRSLAKTIPACVASTRCSSASSTRRPIRFCSPTWKGSSSSRTRERRCCSPRQTT